MCENYEINISAMIDGELHGKELTDTVKHLASCPHCLEQFELFQELQEKLDTQTVREAAPVALWEKLESQMHHHKRPAAKRITFRSAAYATLKYAAVLAVAFLIGYTSHSTIIPILEKDQPIELASDQGHLSDAQFLALTRDLLTADPIYHQKMYQILQTLHSEEWEGNIEPLEQADYSKDDGDTFRF